MAKPVTIAAIEATPVDLPLAAPLNLGGRLKLDTAEAVIVRVASADGAVGWGEAAAAPNLSGELAEGMVAAIRRLLAPALVGSDASKLDEARGAMNRAVRANPAAKAALDLALLDLVGRARGVPVCELLGGAKRSRVPVLRMLGNATIEEDVEEAARCRRDGIAVFKLKVGTRSLDHDIAAAKAVRAAIGPDATLSVDANATWSGDKAIAFAHATAGLDIAYLEQPLRADDLVGLAHIQAATGKPVCADEGIWSLVDLDAHATAAAASGASLKPIKLGGYGVVARAAARAAALGWKINLAAKVAESSLVTAGLLHLAAAAPALDWGLTPTHHYVGVEIVRTPFAGQSGMLEVPAGAGLGVEIDPARLAEFRRR
jgi:muconate cycloisomerase